MFSQATPQNKPWKQGAYVLCLLTLKVVTGQNQSSPGERQRKLRINI